LGRGAPATIARALLKRHREHVKDTIRMVQHVLIGESQHDKSSVMKITIACLVILPNAFDAVRIAVNLDDHTGMKAGTVDVVGTKLHLFAEVPAVGPERENEAPEPNFGDGWLGSKFSA
jgi:hypothetical protein